MQQHIVLWGEIGTDRKALIAIDLNDEQKKVLIYAFPKEEVTEKLQDDLFQVWKNGGDYTFPENVLKWEISELGNADLPDGIELEKPELLAKAYANWLQKLDRLKKMEAFSSELSTIKNKVSELKDFDENIWNETKSKWQEILDAFSKNTISTSYKELLKLDIDEIFEALKAFKRIHKESDFEISQINFKALSKKIETCRERLIYPDEWNKIFDNLKNIQKEVKELPLMPKHSRILSGMLDSVFKEYKKYKETENQNKINGRITDLKRIAQKIQESIAKDEETYKHQFEKMMFYTKGKLSEKEIEERLKEGRPDSKEKLERIKSINKTIKSLEKSLEQKEKPNPNKKKEVKPIKEDKPTKSASKEAEETGQS